MYNHNKAQQSKNRVHISWDILYVDYLQDPLQFRLDTYEYRMSARSKVASLCHTAYSYDFKIFLRLIYLISDLMHLLLKMSKTYFL